MRRLGITENLKGYHHAAYMLARTVQDPTTATLVTKCLYPETAKRFGCSVDAVERNLRTAIRICWDRGDRDFLLSIAGRPLHRRPTNSAFLGMSAAYLRGF